MMHVFLLLLQEVRRDIVERVRGQLMISLHNLIHIENDSSFNDNFLGFSSSSLVTRKRGFLVFALSDKRTRKEFKFVQFQLS